MSMIFKEDLHGMNSCPGCELVNAKPDKLLDSQVQWWVSQVSLELGSLIWVSPGCRMWYQRITEIRTTSTTREDLQSQPPQERLPEKAHYEEIERQEEPRYFRRVCLEVQSYISRWDSINSIYPLHMNHHPPHPRFSPNLTICLFANVSFSTSSPSSPSEYHCLHPSCGHISSSASDLRRHRPVHFPSVIKEFLNCKYEWCGTSHLRGFKTNRYCEEHFRKFQMKRVSAQNLTKEGESWTRFLESQGLDLW